MEKGKIEAPDPLYNLYMPGFRKCSGNGNNYILIDKATYSEEKLFIFLEDVAYKWHDLGRCSTVITYDFQKRGVRRGSHVAICGANSINWMLTFFAVKKLRAIAVLANFNLCSKEIFTLIDSTDVTHFYYGETYATID